MTRENLTLPSTEFSSFTGGRQSSLPSLLTRCALHVYAAIIRMSRTDDARDWEAGKTAAKRLEKLANISSPKMHA